MQIDEQTDQRLRVDKWLWFTRFYKTRLLAKQAVVGGHVKINGERAKPSSDVAPGDIIELVRNQLPFRLVATVTPIRRGPAAEARLSYVENDASIERRRAIQSSIRADRLQMPTTAGKPDKHTRRQLRDRNRRSG
ncbi:MAG: RNA-binding S4 domain-containing protein [Proteobacteria bacterium]|nr:RNA-binding S4 domain-containing protein [Pseudomonadota bacterium]MDA0994026.1 RNA-binding S4 domain-containing protein [Pseudomonadota bacterium]